MNDDSKNEVQVQGVEVPVQPLTSPSHTVLTITPDATSKQISHVYRGPNPAVVDAQPLYLVTTKNNKPHVTLTATSAHGLSSISTIGKATFHKFSSFNTDLDYRGHTITMRPSLSTGFHQVMYPGLGLLTWRTAGNGNKDVELRNGKEQTLARLRDVKAIGRTETQLVVEMQCDEEVEGFLVLSAVALGVRSHLVVGTVGDAVGVTAVGTGVGG